MSLVGRLVVRYRLAVIAVWAVAAVAAIVGFPRLSTAVNPDTSSFLPHTTPSATAARLGADFQPATGSTATLVYSRTARALSRSDLGAVARSEAAVGRLPHVTGVRHDGVSPDGHASRAQVASDVPSHGARAEALTDDIRQAAAAGLAPGLDVNVAGKLAIDTDTTRHNRAADRRTLLLTNLVVLLMLFAVFRSVLAPLVTLLPAVLVLFAGGSLIAELAGQGAFQVSTVANTLFTVLVIGAGTDYGLFLIFRMREEMQAGHDAQEAVRRAVTRVGESIATSGGTVIVALLALLLASFGLYYGMGPTLAIGIALLVAAALTLLPALLAVLGGRVFWPRGLPPGPGRDGPWTRVGLWVVRRPALALATGCLTLGALAVCSLWFSSGGFSGSSHGPGGSDSARADAVLAARFPGSTESPTRIVLRFGQSVWHDLAPLGGAQRGLAASPLFATVNGPFGNGSGRVTPQQLDSLHRQLGDPASLPPSRPANAGISERQYDGYRSLAQFVSPDGRTAQFVTTLTAGPGNSRAAKDAVPGVRAAADAVAAKAGATAAGVAGTAAIAHDVSSLSNDDLVRIVPLVLLLIGILLALVLRSLVAPVYLILSVALSYFAALGLAVVLFDWVGGADGLNFVLPFLMFVFLMALGEDYNILVMTRIREEAGRRPLREAIATALRATGTSVTSAGLVLAATFAVAGLSGATSQVRQLATAISLGILLDTFLVRTLLVPATVALVGRWNWWPSRLRSPADG
jgi:RND superfamily putative drug exporter